MNTKTLLTNKGFEKLIHGHPWLLTQDLKDITALPSTVGLVHVGEHWFFHSPMSKIRLRRFGPTTRGWKMENFDVITDVEVFKKTFADFLAQMFIEKLVFKKSVLIKPKDDLCLRWIFSETDLIPGLIVDVFKNKLACQILTAPVQLFWPVIKESLEKAFTMVQKDKPEILELKNASVRTKEGLDIVESKEATSDWYFWNDLFWWMTPGGDQKTGAYLDQKNNHKETVQWLDKLNLSETWDLCSFEGGFGLHVAKSDRPVVAVDQSGTALETAKKNAEKNEISERAYKTLNEDIFTFLRQQYDNNATVDAIVLDPPSFVKSKAELANAMKGYKELNLRSMHCLKPGGLLVSCACSQNVSREDYLEMLRSAGHDTRRTIHILDVRGPSADHAPLINFPESNYLQAWFLRIE